MRLLILALSATLLLATVPASPGCTPSSTTPEVAAGGFYVVVDECFVGCMPLVWVYEESNGIAGLQRADEVHDDTCGGEIPGDTIWF